eukprot:768074-Hanusia_phi.AAC.10
MDSLALVQDDKENLPNCIGSPACPKTSKRELLNGPSKVKDAVDCRSPAPKSRPSLLALCEMSPMSKSPLSVRSPLHAHTRSPAHKPRMSVLALAEMSPMEESPSLQEPTTGFKDSNGQQALFVEVMKEIAEDAKTKESQGEHVRSDSKRGDEFQTEQDCHADVCQEEQQASKTASDSKEKRSAYKGRESILWFQDLEKGQARESCLANIDLTTLVEEGPVLNQEIELKEVSSNVTEKEVEAKSESKLSLSGIRTSSIPTTPSSLSKRSSSVASKLRPPSPRHVTSQ